MILLKKVVSLKNIFINKSHWLHTLQIHTICKSLVEIGRKFMEISLNYRDLIDFFNKEMLTSLFSLPSTNFHPFGHVKRVLFRPKNYHELSRFFISWRQYRFRDINALDFTNFQIEFHKRKFLREHVIYSFLMDSVIICIHFESNQPPVSLKVTTAAFLIRKTLAITPTNLRKQDLTHSSNVSQGPFYADFCCREGISCFYYFTVCQCNVCWLSHKKIN